MQTEADNESLRVIRGRSLSRQIAREIVQDPPPEYPVPEGDVPLFWIKSIMVSCWLGGVLQRDIADFVEVVGVFDGYTHAKKTREMVVQRVIEASVKDKKIRDYVRKRHHEGRHDPSKRREVSDEAKERRRENARLLGVENSKEHMKRASHLAAKAKGYEIFTPEEVSFLVQLAEQNRRPPTPPGKREKTTNRGNSINWPKVADQFNNFFGTSRSAVVLRRKYDDMRRKVKK